MAFSLHRLYRNIVHRGRVERDLDAELHSTLTLLIEEKIAAGMRAEDARRAALAELGSVEAVKDDVRDVRTGAWLDVLAQDVRYGARLLRRNPLFALTAALSLAVGIGANTTIFTIANRLLLSAPAGVADGGRLADISPIVVGGRGGPSPGPLISYLNCIDLDRRATLLEGVYGYQIEPQPLSLGGRGEAERIFGTIVTRNYFTVLGVRPAAGRLFGEIDSEQPGASPIVVLSHAFWTRRFNADPSIVGQTLKLNGQPFTVVGVASERFRGTSIIIGDVWLPSSMAASVTRDGAFRLGARYLPWLIAGARLRPGVSLAQANAELDAIGAALRQEYSRENHYLGFQLSRTSAVPAMVRVPLAGFLALLMGIVSLVLIIACANVAGILLARAAARRQEIAVRLAIGAGRSRLVRQLLTEAMLLFILGGGAGLFVARAMISLFAAALPVVPVPIDLAFPLDGRVLLFTIALSLISSVLSGLVPALQASRADVVSVLKAHAQGPSDRLRLRNAFVVAQVAFSMLLLVGAGLLLRAMQRTSSVDLGFDPQGVEVAALDTSLAGYTQTTGPRFARDVIERLRKLPGVEHATVATTLPMEGMVRTRRALRRVEIGGGPPEPLDDTMFSPNWSVVGPGYFATLRIPLSRGRDFTETDRRDSQPVAIVSEATVRVLWPGQNPLGKYVPVEPPRVEDPGAGPSEGHGLLVVGVARDLKTDGRHAASPLVYVPLSQWYESKFSILARSRNGQRLTNELRTTIASIDPSLPIVTSRRLEDQASPGLVQLRISASVSGTVGLVGLLLAAIGVYGVTAYTVTRRTREIGIRIAMGAQRGDVIRMILRQGMWLVALGSAAGLALAAAASRLLTRLLFGVPPLDPVSFGGAALLFVLVGLAACYMPVRRATRIDAMSVLRYE